MLQKLLKEGAVYEEMQGWEKPGWFAPNGFAPIFPYDWYGSYGSTKNTDKRYENLLKGDYTFNFSRHHHQVRNSKQKIIQNSKEPSLVR